MGATDFFFHFLGARSLVPDPNLDRAAGDRRASAPPTPRRWPRSASSPPPLRLARPPRLRPTSSHTAPAPAPALAAARPCRPRRHRHPVPGSAPACPTSCAPALAGRGATATQAVRSLPWQEAVRYLFLGYYRMNETDAAWFVLVCSGRQRIVGWRRKGIIGCIAV